MSYQPIENYGIIGDMHSVALVGIDGSIDWLCFPHFDSPSVFAAILDEEKGGRFKISPLPDGVTCRQLYWPDTNVLLTRFFSPDGVGEITDYMPVGKPVEGHGHHQLVRRVKVVRGSMTFRTECFPAFNYARDSHDTEVTVRGACFRSSCLSLHGTFLTTRDNTPGHQMDSPRASASWPNHPATPRRGEWRRNEQPTGL